MRSGRWGSASAGRRVCRRRSQPLARRLGNGTPDRVQVDWATSTGDEGVALMLIADRLSDLTKAEKAVQQIGVAFVVMRDSGNTPAAAYYGEQLLKARALFGRLTSH